VLTALVAGGSSGRAAYIRARGARRRADDLAAGVIVLAAWLTPPRRSAGCSSGSCCSPSWSAPNVAGPRALVALAAAALRP
jgi:hypothetical protein